MRKWTMDLNMSFQRGTKTNKLKTSKHASKTNTTTDHIEWKQLSQKQTDITLDDWAITLQNLAKRENKHGV